MLEVRDLAKCYDEVVALASLDLAVERGRCSALVGHNGSGKSTALACMSGRVSPSGGSVALDGRPLFDDVDDVWARAALSFVSDAPAFYTELNVREHLELVAVAHGLADDAPTRVDRLLAELRLEHRARFLPRQLSAGMRQKLQLACGLARPFDALLLDEPARHLDAGTAGWLTERIGEEKARGSAVVVASHEPFLVQDVADEVVVLVEGHVTFRGSYAEAADTPEGRQLGFVGTLT